MAGTHLSGASDDNGPIGTDPTPDDDRRSDDRALDAAAVGRLRDGDDRAFGELYDRWFDRVHDLCRRIVRNDDTAAEVTQDTFLAAWKQLDGLRDPASFGGWLLRIARNRSLNRLEREQRSTAVGDEAMAAIESDGAPVNAPAGFGLGERVARAEDPAIATEDREVADFVWGAADALGERDRTVLTLQLRDGLTPAEIGDVVGVNRNAANQLVHRVKKKLETALQARVVWSGGEPACELLAADLAAAGVTHFGAAAVKVVDRHVDSCEECGERRRLKLQPAALFSAIPVVAAPVALKTRVATALEAEGVSMSGSVHGGSASGSAGEADGSGGESGSGPDAGSGGPGGGPRRGRWIAAAVAMAAVLLVVAFLALADDDTEPIAADAPVEADDDVDGVEVTTSDPDTTTTVAPPTTLGFVPFPNIPSSVPVAPGETPPPLQTPGPGPSPPSPGPPPPSPPPPTVSYGLSPSSTSAPYPVGPGAPELTWSVQGATSVVVIGPNFYSTQSSGSAFLCPNGPGTFCPDTALGDFTYLLRAYGPSGELLVQRQVVLTLT